MIKRNLSDREIEELYDTGEYRLHQERNDFFLPQIVDYVKLKKWLNLKPEYQRRLVWDRKKKSLLIESLLMNVPIPPVFLFEYDLNHYEVMDGQQRLNTIIEFYENRFPLSGLVTWKALNGRHYADCPPRIRSGLDRRRISATTLLAESGKNASEKNDIRRTVFERLNTGGLNLNAQELRNSLYLGKFNELITKLAGNRLFDEIWEIPPYDDNIRGGQVSTALRDNARFKRMEDCEIVLRFFAFRRRTKIKGSVKKILDQCMEDYSLVTDKEISALKTRFMDSLELAYGIFEDYAFRIPVEKKGEPRLSAPLYDAVMVALDSRIAHREKLLGNRRSIQAHLFKSLEDEDNYQLVVGRPNTAKAIKGRQDFVLGILNEHI